MFLRRVGYYKNPSASSHLTYLSLQTPKIETMCSVIFKIAGLGPPNRTNNVPGSRVADLRMSVEEG
jgi:hypothetical protein